MVDFKVPGEHVYRGLTFNCNVHVDTLDKIPDFPFIKDDVLIATYPKAGTTWLQQITWFILNNVDLEASRKEPINARSLFLEHSTGGVRNIDVLATMKSPRLIKTHLPSDYFKSSIDRASDIGFKTVVGMRNPKDVLVSFFHFYKMNKTLGSFNRSFDEFFTLFQARRIIFGDYFDHVLSWWKERENPNLYFVKYEDLKADPSGEICKLASFLGKTLSETDLTTIISESSFDSMKANPMANYDNVPVFDKSVSEFIRKGEVGDWKNYFTEDQRQFVDARSVAELEPQGLTLHDTSLSTISYN